MNTLIDDLLVAVGTGRIAWPDVGVFGLNTRKRVPGFAGFTRMQFWPSEHFWRLLNDGDAPAQIETAPSLATDDAFAAHLAKSIATALKARGEITVPGLGLFGVEKRKTTAEDQYTVIFHADPALLRRLNPEDRDYEAALAWEWPGGAPASPTDENGVGPN